MNKIDEMKKKRFQFLHRLYELTGGNENVWPNMFQIGQELEFDKKLTEIIVQYLAGEELITHHGIGGTIGISHWGIQEVEEVLSKPEVSTTHFLPYNVIQIGTMTGSQIQQGSPGATQIITLSENKNKEIEKVLQLLKRNIDQFDLKPQQKSDLQVDIQTIEAQMSSSKPKATIITECLNSIRKILEAATASVVASQILEMIRNLF